MEVIETQPKPKQDLRDNQNSRERPWVDYSPRALWLRAMVLGGHEGLTAMALVLIGVGMVTPKDHHRDIKPLLLTCFATLVAGALSLANAEYVSVYTQYDTMKFQEKREMRRGLGERNWLVPSPSVVAACAAVTYVIGGSVPLLAAVFIQGHKMRTVVASVMASLSMIAVGIAGAALGNSPIARSCARCIFGGWLGICLIWGKSEFLKYMGI
ncbi:hypothetical protein NL676_013156 [Syzygium grande]|nr:hypothetical protein NL676_013156 [Syzygium grande]